MKFEIKIKRNQMLRDATKNQIQLTKWPKTKKKIARRKIRTKYDRYKNQRKMKLKENSNSMNHLK